MPIAKKILLNSLIVLGVLFAVLCGLVAVMYFANVNMFGYAFKKPKAALQYFDLETSVGHDYHPDLAINGGQGVLNDFHKTEIKRIIIYSDVVNTVIKDISPQDRQSGNGGNGIVRSHVSLSDGSWGLIKAKHKGKVESKLILEQPVVAADPASGELTCTIRITAPKGTIFYTNTKLTVYLSDTFYGADGADREIVVNSKGGGLNVYTPNIASGTAWQIATKRLCNLEFNTTGKDYFTAQNDMSNVKIANKSGAIRFTEDIAGDLTVNTTTAKITAKNVGGKVEIWAKNSNASFDNITGSLTYLGPVTKASGGKLRADSVGGFIGDTKSANVHFKHVEGLINYKASAGKFTVDKYSLINASEENKIVAGKARVTLGKTDLTDTELGTVEIGKLSVTNTSGSVTIRQAFGAANAELNLKTSSGKINYNGQTENGSEFLGNLVVSSSKGRINLQSISSLVTASINGNGGGSITAVFNNLVDGSAIQTYSGSLTAKIPADAVVSIRTASPGKKGKVSLKINDYSWNQKTEKTTRINGALDGVDPLLSFTSSRGKISVVKK